MAGPPPASAQPWEELARAGRTADAIVAYVMHHDWTTFAELHLRFARYLETSGDVALELRPNVIVWAGLSVPMADAMMTVLSQGRVHPHVCGVLPYFIDGRALRMPIAKNPPPAGYRSLKAALRTWRLRARIVTDTSPKLLPIPAAPSADGAGGTAEGR